MAAFASAVLGRPGPALALALGFGDGVVGGSSIDFAVVGVVFVTAIVVVGVVVGVVFVVFTVLSTIAWMYEFHSA